MTDARKIFGSILLALCVLHFPPTAWADAFPNKPLHLVVPFPPGAGTDMFARVIAEKLSKSLGEPVVVDNKPGGSAVIGTEFVAKSAPNGYTLLISTASHAINPSVLASLPYDTLRDFTNVALVATVPTVLVVHPSVPVTSVRELVDLAKAKPGQLNMGSSSTGTIFHLAGEMLKSMAGIDMLHVPFSGGGPALTALLGGHVNVLFETTLTVRSYAKSGRLRVLAVGSEHRTAALPETPTMAEAGFPELSAQNWYGIYVPASTPQDIVMKLNHEIVAALKLADVQERFDSQGAEIIASTPEQHTAFLKAEIQKWGGVARNAHVKAD